MKDFIKLLLAKFGYTIANTKVYNKLININNVTDSDCVYILKNYINTYHLAQLDFFYFIKNLIDSNKKMICLDVGANVGQTANKFRKYFPNSRIYCFEPVKETFNKLQENLNQYSNIHVYNCALGSVIHEMEIFHREYSDWNSLVVELNEKAKNEGATSEKIRVNTVDLFLKENGIEEIEILKSDTEGFELEVLKGAKNSLENQNINVIYAEVGFNKQDIQHTYFIDLIEYLAKYDYQFSGFFEVVYDNNMVICYANALFVSEKSKVNLNQA